MLLYLPIILLLALSLTFFLYHFIKKPYTLWFGFWTLASVFFSVVLVLFLVMSINVKNPTLLNTFMLILLFLFGGLIILFVLLLFLVPIFSGLRLIKREGFSLSHALSLLFGVLCLLYLTIWPLLSVSNPIGSALYSLLSGIIVYLAFMLLLYTLTALLNMSPHHKLHFDYILVLGSGLINGKVPPLLASRIDKGIEYAQKHNLQPFYVFSGGQGIDEPFPEAEAMSAYAVKQGIDSKKIIKEIHSTSTFENITYSSKIIAEHHQQTTGSNRKAAVLITTNRYHLFRALLIAKKQGLHWEGLGAKTKLYFSLNAFLREYIAYLVMTKKTHLIIGSLLVIVNLLTSSFVQSWITSLMQQLS